MTKNQKKILKDVSSQVGLPYEVVEKVWRTQWKMVRDTISKGDRLAAEEMPEMFIRGCCRMKPVDGLIDKINKAQDGKARKG